jgi:RecA-family ATPase
MTTDRQQRQQDEALRQALASMEQPAGPHERNPKPNGLDAGAAAFEPIIPIGWAALAGLEPPPRPFLIAGMLPIGVATSLYGAGGAGKSLLALLAAICVALGLPFLGKNTTQSNVLFLGTEDDDEEIWRRALAICRYLMVDIAELEGRLITHGRVGMDNALVDHPLHGPAKALPLLEHIELTAARCGLIVLDNISQMFIGEEISRRHVVGFVNLMNRLARRLRAAVLLLGHENKKGDAYAGSAAWRDIPRALWTLRRPREEGIESEPSDVLLLTIDKANYGPKGEQLRLRWHDGVIRLAADGRAARTSLDKSWAKHERQRIFLAALDELSIQKRAISANSRAANYGPKIIIEAGLNEGHSSFDLKLGMNELLHDRRIVVDAQLWRRPNRLWVLGIARNHPGLLDQPGIAVEPENGDPDQGLTYAERLVKKGHTLRLENRRLIVTPDHPRIEHANDIAAFLYHRDRTADMSDTADGDL